MDHLSLFGSLNPMTSVLIKDSRREDGEKRKRPCEDRGRDWSSAARSQERLESPELGRCKKGLSLEPLEGAQPVDTLILDFQFPKR